MSHTVELPALGESVTEGTVTRWLVAVGDTIAVDEPLVEVSTDKVDTEVPSPVAGVVEQILVEEDEDVEVGAPLVVIGDGSGAAPAAPAAPVAEAPAAAAAPAAPAVPAAPAAAAPAGAASGQEVTLPALGESVTEGTVTRWLKEVGEQVEVDEPLVEVSTDKVDTEVPSPVAGTLLEIRIQEDEDAEVGQVLAIIGDASAAAPAAAAPAAPAPVDEAPEAAAPAAPAAETPAPAAGVPATADGEAYVTPLVRKLAKDNNIDLSTVKGTGVGGRIRKQDVQAAIAAKGSAAPAAASAAPAAEAGTSKAPHTFEVSPKRGTVEKTARIRQVIAKRMRESLDTSTQLTQVTEVDMTRVAQLRAKAKDGFLAREGAKLTFLPFFAQAVTEALQQHPALNASMTEDLKQITYPDSENIAIAVDTPKGLLVPVIRNASDLGIAGLAKAIADLGGRARTGDIAPEELAGSTFTITNIGSFGALFDTPIINQPNVAILGTGSIVKRPMVVKDVDGNDSIAIRSMCYLSLTYDHRVVDGADAGRFLYTLKTRLEEANFEAEVGL